MAFFFIVIASVRVDEMASFARLILVLSVITAIGTLYEAHSGFNAFYVYSQKLLHRSPRSRRRRQISTRLPAIARLSSARRRMAWLSPAC